MIIHISSTLELFSGSPSRRFIRAPTKNNIATDHFVVIFVEKVMKKMWKAYHI